MSETVLLLNPRRKRRAKGRRRMSALQRMYFGKRRRRATNPRRHRRRARARSRRRHYPVVAAPRRRRRALMVNPRRRRRHSYRLHRRRYSNPRRARRFGGFSAGGLRGAVRGYVVPGVIGGIGTLALDVVYGYVSPHLPAQFQAGWFGVAAKLAVIIGTGMVVGRFAPRLRSKVQAGVLGATTVLAYGAIKQAVAGMIPAGTNIPGLSGYGLGAYLPDFQSMPVRGGMGAYMPTRNGLGDYYSPAAVIGAGPSNAFGAYMPRSQPHTSGGQSGVAGFDFMNDGM